MSEPTTSTERLAILYGSETGNSESIAKRLHHAAVHNHGHPDALCLTLNQAITKKILDGQCSEEATPLCLVIVCSTTGEGEPPENAARFRRWLRNHPTTTPLHHLRFTVLALGDTNYNNFCAAGIYMDNKLHEAGGVRFYARGEADDGIGLDLVVEPWMEHLWPAMIGQPEQGVSHTRYQTTNITEQRWNMAVAQEVLILYDCNSLLCSTYALYVYERLTELGGVGELQPVQHLVVERLARTPKLLLLLASADAGADGAQAMSTQHKPDAEVGGGAPSPSSLSSSSTTAMWMDLQPWLAVAGLRAAQSLCILTSPAEVQRAVVVESALRELLHACKLEAIVRKVPHTPTIATSAADLLLWCEAVLDTTPGITHDTATIRVALERRFGKHVLPALRLANATHGGDDDDGMAAFDGNERTRGDAEEGGADHGRLLHGPILSDLLTPLVFLYASTGSRLSAEVAQRMHATAEEHQLRSSLTDISKLRMTGFPRRATFIFIVNGISKAMSRVMKVLRDGVRRGKHLSQDNFAGVRFAILGIDNGRRSDHFNLCALELETLLLSLHATKIHATGLVDEGCQDSVPAVLQAWESNLLSAVMAPTTSRAYLDAQSPNITSVAPVFPSFGGPLPRGVEGGVDVAAPEVVAQILSSPTSTQSFERIISPVQPTTTTTPTKTEGGTQTTNNNNHTAGMLMMMMEDGATNATTLPWRPLPLHRANVAHTPLTLLYASSGMPKAMALHACKAAQEMGFVATTHSLADTQRMDFSQHPNLLLFCEGGRLAGQNRGAQLLRRSLLHPSRRPDALSFVRFSILGLGAVEPAHTHPAFQWAGLLARLQANRVFPVVVMRSMSQLHSFGLPWCECAMAAMAAQPPLLVPPSNTNNNTNTATTRDDDDAAAAAATNKDATLVQPTTSDVPSDGAKVLFLFGSSTGMAEAIARDLHQQALQLGYASRVAALKFFEKMSFLTTPHVIIVCSTTNLHVGGFPSNARKFAQYLQLRAQPRNLLTGTHYAVLGVGNESAYPHTFCSAAIRIDARLEELGGRRICEMGRLDVSHSILARMAAWRMSLFDALRATTTEAQGVMVEEDSSSTSCPHPHHHLHHPSALVPPALPTSEGCTDASCPSSPATLQKWGVLLVQGSSDTSAVMGITEHLRQVIQDNTTLQPATCTMNEFAKLTWRTRYRLIIFLVASNDEGDCPLNATAFFRLLRHKSTPRDLFASVRYTVMAVSDTNEGRFYLGRQLDRRLEELGGTRCFARGEAVDSFRLERTVERWIHGLMAILADACEECSEGAQQQQQQQQRAMAPCAARTTNKLGSANFNHATTSSDKNNTAAAASSHVDDGDGAMDAADLTAMAASPVDRIAAFMPRTGSDEVRVEAVIDGWRCLTSPHVQECGGTVLLMHLRVAPEVVWVPGQTVAILPPNPHEAVQRVLRYFDVKAEMPFHPLSVAGVGSSSYPNAPLYESVDFPVSVETLLLRYVGITLSPTNSRGLMEMLLQRSGEHAEMQERIRAYWQEMCATRVPRRLEEVLDALPHLPITLRHLVEHLPLLQPRIYSICSSKLATPTRLSLCFKVVPHGLCTHWLLDQCVWAARLSTNTNTNTMSSSVAAASAGWGCEVRAQRTCGLSLVLRPTSDFIMPPQLTTPLISIGPGTGVAPFRAFIEERGALMRQQQQQSNNNNVEEPSTCAATLGSMELFFGCRRREDDFLFAEELVEAERCGILSSLHVAFSREPNNDGSFWYGGCYVQDKMLEAAGVLVDVLVHRQGRLYVCGDAEMAKEVHQTFLDILQQHLCISATAAATLVENMVSRGEYLRDVWTTSLP